MARTIRQLRNERGFSLTEMLVTLVILVLVSMIVATGVPAAWKSYQNVVDASNAQLLLATTTSRLREVLSAADPEEEIDEGATVTFTSLSTGMVTQLANETVGEVDGIGIREALTKGDLSSSEPNLLIPKSAAQGAGSDLVVSFDKISCDADKEIFTVKGLKVKRGEEVIANAKADALKIAILATPTSD